MNKYTDLSRETIRRTSRKILQKYRTMYNLKKLKLFPGKIHVFILMTLILKGLPRNHNISLIPLISNAFYSILELHLSQIPSETMENERTLTKVQISVP